jgi:hypothetical protein
MLADRREFAVVEVIEALGIFGQPELLETKTKNVPLAILKGEAKTEFLVAPRSRRT